MELNVDLIKPGLMRIKLKGIHYPNSHKSKTNVDTYSLVHSRGTYYISLGYRISSYEDVTVSEERVKFKLTLNWHLHKPVIIKNNVKKKVTSTAVPIKVQFSEEKHHDDISCLFYPSTVWGEAGLAQKLLNFENEGNCRVWKSSCGNLRDYYPFHFPCLIWIKFDDHSGDKKSLEVFKDIFANQINCDVQFCFAGGKNIGAHQTVLGARSCVFAAMFQTGVLELRIKQFPIKDFEPEIFKEFLHYIYARRIFSNFTEIKSRLLLLLAKDYDIRDLKEECIRFLLSSIRIENAIDLLVWAHVHSVKEVKEGALALMEIYGKEVVELKQWEELAKKHPELSVLATRRIMSKTPSKKEDALAVLRMELDSSSEEE